MISKALISRYYSFFACGDALGKATEMLSQNDIRMKIGHVNTLVDCIHRPLGNDVDEREVTDDTQINMYLLKQYLADGDINIANTVEASLKWCNETNALEKHYIGPSSFKALSSILEGADPLKTGKDGTTDGGLMRCPAAAIAAMIIGKDIGNSVYNCIVATHNTQIAMEAAFAYSFALEDAFSDGSIESIFESAITGSIKGSSLVESPIEQIPHIHERLAYLKGLNLSSMDDEEVKRFIYCTLGSGLASDQCLLSVFALLQYTKDPVKIMFMASELGGDTDTIAALAGSMACLLCRDAVLPENVAGPVLSYNRKLLDGIVYTKEFD